MFIGVMVSNLSEQVTLESFANDLIEIGTAFIAIPIHPLSHHQLHFCTFAPGNNGLNSYAREVEAVEQVTIDDHKFEFRGISNVLHSEVHFEDRIPLYAVSDSMLGLSEISLDEGLTNLEAFLTGDYDTKSPEEIAPLKTLVVELIEGGAVAVGLQKGLFEVEGTSIPLRVHMPPVIGRKIAGQYKAVSVEGETYSHRIEAVIDGPGFFQEVPVYADDSIRGMDTVPVEEGIQNVCTYLAEPSKA